MFRASVVTGVWSLVRPVTTGTVGVAMDAQQPVGKKRQAFAGTAKSSLKRVVTMVIGSTVMAAIATANVKAAAVEVVSVVSSVNAAMAS